MSYTIYSIIILENGYEMSQNNYPILRKSIYNETSIKNLQILPLYFFSERICHIVF